MHVGDGETTESIAEVVFVSVDDVVTFLQTQHEVIAGLFETVLESRGKERERSFYQLRRLLAVHETAEEQIVHPFARTLEAVGDEVVDTRLEEEHEAKTALAHLETLPLDSAAFEDALGELQSAVLAHAEAEEEEEFLVLDDELDEAQLFQMRRLVQLSEAIAPTRPHPGVESALANTLVGPFASMLDRIRDLVAGKRGT
jgi:hemerythrin superfamily protein